MKPRKTPLTQTDFLVVIAVIILAPAIITAALDSARHLAKIPLCQNNLRQIGAAVYECVYKWFPTEGKAVFQKLLYMILDGVGYTFSANFTKRSLKTIAKQVEGIINTLAPLGAATEDE